MKIGYEKVSEIVPATLVAVEQKGIQSKPIESRVLMGAEYSGELVTDGPENMDCGVAQAVERVVGTARASAEERYKGRLNSEPQQCIDFFSLRDRHHMCGGGALVVGVTIGGEDREGLDCTNADTSVNTSRVNLMTATCAANCSTSAPNPLYSPAAPSCLKQFLRRNCLLQDAKERKVEGKRSLGRRIHILDDLEERRNFWELKEEKEDRSHPSHHKDTSQSFPECGDPLPAMKLDYDREERHREQVVACRVVLDLYDIHRCTETSHSDRFCFDHVRSFQTTVTCHLLIHSLLPLENRHVIDVRDTPAERSSATDTTDTCIHEHVLPINEPDSSHVLQFNEPDSSHVFQLNEPDSSHVLQFNEPDSSRVFQLNEPDSSRVFELNEPDSSRVFQLNEPDSSHVLQFNEPDSSRVFQLNEPDSSHVFELNEPDSSHLLQFNEPDLTHLLQLNKLDLTHLLQLNELDLTHLLQFNEPDSSRLNEPDSSHVFQLNEPDSSHVLQFNEPDSSRVFQLNEPDSSHVFELNEPDSSHVFELNEPDSSHIISSSYRKVSDPTHNLLKVKDPCLNAVRCVKCYKQLTFLQSCIRIVYLCDVTLARGVDSCIGNHVTKCRSVRIVGLDRCSLLVALVTMDTEATSHASLVRSTLGHMIANAAIKSTSQGDATYSSPMTSLVLTDSSQLTALGSYQTKLCIPMLDHMNSKNMCLAAVTSDMGWGANHNIQGFGEQPTIKSQVLHLVRSIRTVTRFPLIFLNILTIIVKLILG
uniref:Immediate early response 3-interacting protein 1 n=1 Tax=Timema shepardi TaxID=629360 RepID=A0A7R9B1Y9_TIMSH|nr:unnamed protein product [Timema shepardi]